MPVVTNTKPICSDDTPTVCTMSRGGAGTAVGGYTVKHRYALHGPAAIGASRNLNDKARTKVSTVKYAKRKDISIRPSEPRPSIAVTGPR